MEGQDGDMHPVINLTPLPSGIRAACALAVQIDAHKTTYVAIKYGKPKCLLTYNINTDQWSEEHPMIAVGGELNSSHIAYDKSTSRLYLASLPMLRGIDHMGNEISNFNTNLHFKRRGCTMLSIEDNIHFISGEFDKHLVWSTRTRSILSGPNPIGIHVPDKKDQLYRAGGCAVYVPGENAILLIGGMTDSIGMAGNPIYDDVVWKGVPRSPDCSQWDWQRLKEHGPGIPLLNAVVTADSRYVIVSVIDEGGYYYREEWFQYIYVIDVRNNYQWRRTEINIPLPKKEAFNNEYYGKHFMFRTGDGRKTDLIVSGWIRKEYRMEAFKDLMQVPKALIDIIQSFHDDELFHWVNDEGHAAIRLCDILSAPSHAAIGSCRRC